MIALLVTLAAAQDTLEEEVRAAQERIEQVRGLPFRDPVRVQRVARPEGAQDSIQGYYSPSDRALVVYDDVRSNYREGVLLHELAHALQDQHFGLASLHQEAHADGELARDALVEGDAVLTMIEALGPRGERARAMLTPRWDRDPERTLLYSTGAAFVEALRQRGGWDEVNRAFRDPPRTTEEILHPDRFAPGVSGRGGPVERGEFGILRWLLEAGAAPDAALPAADGWAADETVDGAWRVLWRTADDAREFLAAARPATAGETVIDDEDALVAVQPSGVRALVRAGRETTLIEAADLAALDRALAPAVDLTGLAAWTILDAETLAPVSLGEFLDAAAAARIVGVGETHDSPLHHQAQLAVIRALAGLGGRTGVGMEMFERQFQRDIDAYFADNTDEAEFLRSTEYATRWSFDYPSLYKPIVDFCRSNGVPLAGLNAPRELVRRVSREGWEGLSDTERGALGTVDFDVPAHREHWHGQFAVMHGQAPDPAQEARMYQAMCVWDDYMAASAAEFLQRRRLDRIVVVAGSGHVDFGFGIPDRAARRAGGARVVVHIEPTLEEARTAPAGVADFLLVPR